LRTVRDQFRDFDLDHRHRPSARAGDARQFTRGTLCRSFVGAILHPELIEKTEAASYAAIVVAIRAGAQITRLQNHRHGSRGNVRSIQRAPTGAPSVSPDPNPLCRSGTSSLKVMKDTDPGALDRALGGDQQFDQTLRDEALMPPLMPERMTCG
jgi:hypothetical protein